MPGLPIEAYQLPRASLPGDATSIPSCVESTSRGIEESRTRLFTRFACSLALCGIPRSGQDLRCFPVRIGEECVTHDINNRLASRDLVTQEIGHSLDPGPVPFCRIT